jgi:hypothetical protein
LGMSSPRPRAVAGSAQQPGHAARLAAEELWLAAAALGVGVLAALHPGVAGLPHRRFAYAAPRLGGMQRPDSANTVARPAHARHEDQAFCSHWHCFPRSPRSTRPPPGVDPSQFKPLVERKDVVSWSSSRRWSW